MAGIIASKLYHNSIMRNIICFALNTKAKWDKTRIIKRKRQRSDIIKVAFIVQMPEVWDKEAPLFETMTNDKRFEPWLIIMPHYDFAENKLGEHGEDSFFFLKKYPYCHCVLYGQDAWELDESFDCVFYQRCWEVYLPEELRCKKTIKKAVTCYIPYDYDGAQEKPTFYQTSFFRNLSLFYCCSQEQCDQVLDIGLENARFLGFPAFDRLDYPLKNKGNNVKVLWTPRWTNDCFGGSNFFAYKDHILDLAKLPGIELVLRPHPLTFDNAVREGIMTKDDVSLYKQKVLHCGACFDQNKMIAKTFIDTDILITDYSSVIILFFLSGRPVIYCGKKNFTLVDTFDKILNASYVASDWDSVMRIVNDLKNGLDPLMEERKNVIQQISPQKNSAERIKEDLYYQLRIQG